jgi:uncharacterized membrane protein (DUF106 family)
MGLFFLWIIFSLIVGAVGSNRRIGFWGAFLLSLILSPIIGLIITLISKDKEDDEYKKRMYETQNRQEDTLSDLKENINKKSVFEELEKIKKMRDEGILTEDEFQKAKQKILSTD